MVRRIRLPWSRGSSAGRSPLWAGRCGRPRMRLHMGGEATSQAALIMRFVLKARDFVYSMTLPSPYVPLGDAPRSSISMYIRETARQASSRRSECVDALDTRKQQLPVPKTGKPDRHRAAGWNSRRCVPQRAPSRPSTGIRVPAGNRFLSVGSGWAGLRQAGTPGAYARRSSQARPDRI